jgi:hypothetical protein
MGLLKNLFGSKEEPITSYHDFWSWFQKNEKDFYRCVEQHSNIEKNFFDKLSPKLNELKEGFLFLTGMYDDNTVELILTADGTIKNFVFVEELVQAAPVLKGWKFTALKPAMDINDVSIEMDGLKFGSENLSFYSNDLAQYPDEIDITIVHNDLNEENRSAFINGTYIFLDNYLGELDFATNIDNLEVVGKKEAIKELVPIGKLKDFLIWRQKEFIEKYDGIRLNTEKDNHSILEARLPNGNGLIAAINTDLLKWDKKGSHPWVLSIELKYDGTNNNGMPGKDSIALLEEIEDDILKELKDADGYLNIGRQTSDGQREIYITCKDFRKPSKVLHAIERKYADRIELSYEIYKDKYWQSFNRFQVN